MRLPIALIACLLVAGTATPASAGEPESKRLNAPLEMRLELKKDKPTYGTPIEFDIVVTNRGKKTVPFYAPANTKLGGAFTIELIDQHGAVWLPVERPIIISPSHVSLYDVRHPGLIIHPRQFPFRDGVQQIAPGKSFRRTLRLEWYRRQVPLPGSIQPIYQRAGLPQGKWSLRVRYEQKGAQVPSALPFYPPRQIRTEPVRPMKLVPALFQGKLAAERTFQVTAPIAPEVEALHQRIRALEAKLAKANRVLEQLRKVLSAAAK